MTRNKKKQLILAKIEEVDNDYIENGSKLSIDEIKTIVFYRSGLDSLLGEIKQAEFEEKEEAKMAE